MSIMYPLLQAAEDHITATDLVHEYTGFLAYFGVFGALGFRWLVLARTGNGGQTGSPVDDAVTTSLRPADSGAAIVGLIGTLFMLINLLMSLAARAADKGTSLGAAITAGGSRLITPFVFIALFLILFGIALKRVRAAWIVAGLVGIAYALQNITSGKWASLVNPVHETAASLWLGTLLVVVVVGLPAILRSALPSERRGLVIADMIGRFSPVAICASLLLVTTGVITAWRHLRFVAALWTTSYGYALDVKLVFVATVIVLGAWNWRRMKPRLGTEAAAQEIHRSAKAELTVAGIVLLITGVLVSLPSPHLPHP